MEQSGGVIAAKRAKPSEDVDAAAIEDRLSALPDDVLVTILLHLHSAAAAVRTSVLSRRWRRVWALLPHLCFQLAADGHRIRKLLEVPEAPQIRRIYVTTEGAGPGSVAAWLPVAARRLSGRLIYHNMVPGNGKMAAGGRGKVRLPCFEKATKIELNLGFLGLALPSSSPAVFARLGKLYLSCIRFRGPCQLGNAVSSQQCPCLKKLKVRDSWVRHNLSIHSESLIQIKLRSLIGLRQLTIVAPTLQDLSVEYIFLDDDLKSVKPVANISAPQLVDLEWSDLYDPQSIHLGDLGQLQCLATAAFRVYGQHDDRINHDALKLLQRFQDLESLKFSLKYDKVIDGFQYLMEDITMLPHVKSLNLAVINEGHAFGASSFHLLRMCIGLRMLSLVFYTSNNLEAPSACPSGCICDQRTNWKTEELSLNRLEDVAIIGLIGAEHEICFVRRLLDWATALKNMKLVFDYSISESKVREFQQRLSGFRRPETYVQFFMCRNKRRHPPYLPVPQDQGTRV